MTWTWLAILGATAAEQVAGAREGTGEPEGASSIAARESDSAANRGRPSGLRTAVAAGLAVALVAPTLVDVPARHRRVDASANDGGERWLDAAIGRLEPDAVVVSWWSYSTPLWYAQHVERRIPNVVIVDDRTRLDEHLGDVDDVIERYLDDRPVYLIRAGGDELRRLAERYALDPGPTTNVLVRVTGRLQASP